MSYSHNTICVFFLLHPNRNSLAYNRVHVADLGLDPSKREIEKAFEKFGPLIEVWVARNPPCFAFVVYKYKEDADNAIREMDGQ